LKKNGNLGDPNTISFMSLSSPDVIISSSNVIDTNNTWVLSWKFNSSSGSVRFVLWYATTVFYFITAKSSGVTTISNEFNYQLIGMGWSSNPYFVGGFKNISITITFPWSPLPAFSSTPSYSSRSSTSSSSTVNFLQLDLKTTENYGVIVSFQAQTPSCPADESTLGGWIIFLIVISCIIVVIVIIGSILRFGVSRWRQRRVYYPSSASIVPDTGYNSNSLSNIEVKRDVRK